MKHCLMGRGTFRKNAPGLSAEKKIAVLEAMEGDFRAYYHRPGEFPYLGGIRAVDGEGFSAFGYAYRGEDYVYESKSTVENLRIALSEVFAEEEPEIVVAFDYPARALVAEILRILYDEYGYEKDDAEAWIRNKVFLLYEAPDEDIDDARLVEILSGTDADFRECVDFGPLQKEWEEAMDAVAAAYRKEIAENRKSAYNKDLNFPNPRGVFIGTDGNLAGEMWEDIRKIFEALTERPQWDIPDIVFCLEDRADPEINLDLRTRHKIKVIPVDFLPDLFVTDDPFLEDFYGRMAIETTVEVDPVAFARSCRDETEGEGGIGYEFHVYAPAFDEVFLYLYPDALSLSREKIPMKKEGEIFKVQIPMERLPVYYNFGAAEFEIVDPYAKALSLNGRRGYAFDEIERFYRDDYIARPAHPVICELHVKDFTLDGIEDALAGTFLGAAQAGVQIADTPVGFDHLKALGVDYIHLMPVMNYISVWEQKASKYDADNYNWGYDPDHYFALENSYATDPADPVSAIEGLSHLIESAHGADIGIVLDVVYNHLYLGEKSDMARLNPACIRYRKDGNLSDGSGTGTEIASEDVATGQLIRDSVRYMQKLGVDGFRFDLAALTDSDTLSKIEEEARETNPATLLYGEPWTAAETALDPALRLNTDSREMHFFDDAYRNGLRGDSYSKEIGWIGGDVDAQPYLEQVLMGEGKHRHNLAYFSCHDDLVLGDFLDAAMQDASEEEKERTMKLAFAVLMITPGPVLFHAADEFLRRRYKDNPYNGPLDNVVLHWHELVKKSHLSDYVADLIALRKELDLSKHSFLHREAGFVVLENGDKRIFINVTDAPKDITHWLYPKTRWRFMEQGAADKRFYLGQILGPRNFVVIEAEE
ncbi:pullulanase/glycogen debranching enzyme [Peptoniphilus ivorii]|uniref:alpha-amylase family glycosyl hydrolase n=1 Tax=Aedoeadaptatus ivorii TaxID=54006 RepID=UPI002788E25F|nr:alpha-amylase family glycosyl hydrolase [Peptoniphilus ivorii]MDQ0508576.1 pullulanase/glycogen debranching enzyme [Peptoniphilus ivorii]